MGNGIWTRDRFDEYSSRRYGVGADELERLNLSRQDVFRQKKISKALDPHGVMRECCDSEEHPNTLPVILALDVTGSMGSAAVRTATRLNSIMTGIFCSGEVRDVEFCVMALGDIHYDRAPIQISQFESDIRIAEQMDDVYFEGGGGSNEYESYSAAWYMGLEHCSLHCWNRGQKGLIITMGDELPNPCLNAGELSLVTGDRLQADVGTAKLLDRARAKYEIFHLSVDDPCSSYRRNQKMYNLDKAWTALLGRGHYQVVEIDGLHKAISRIVSEHAARQNSILKNASAGVGHFW